MELRTVDIGLIEGSKAPLAAFPLWMLTFADLEAAKEEPEEQSGDGEVTDMPPILAAESAKEESIQNV